MTERCRDQSGGYAIGPWQTGRATLTATGPTPAAVVAAGLAGVLAAQRGEIDPPRFADEATTALPLRADAGDVAALFAALATALLDELDHADYDVRAVRFDGLVRADDGLTGWGYALAIPGGQDRTPLTIEDVLVAEAAGEVTLRAALRRAG